MISLRNRKNRLNVQQKNKINEIREALNNNDIYTLRNLSRTEGGFVTSELRKLCWPFLLHVDVSNIRISENKTDITSDLSDEINNENLNSDDNENQDTIIKESSENIDNQNNITEELDKNINETIQTIVVPENEIEEEIINQTNINEKSNNNITNEKNNNNSNNIEKIDSTQQNEKTDTEVNNDKNNNIQNEQKENNESIEQTESNEKKIESPDKSIVEETIKKDEQNEKTDTEENTESIKQTESNEEKIESQVVDKPEESIVEEIIKTDEQKESNNSEITNNEILLNRDIPNNNINYEIKNEEEVVKEKENNPEIKKEVDEEKEIEIKKDETEEKEEKEEKKEEGENKSENVVEKEENKVDDENENNDKKKSNNEFQENFDNNKDDLNSETLKDENIENIENITQENIIIASQSSNEDTYLEKESLNKKDNLSEKSDNEDYTKNNHTDDEGDDVLFKGEIDINAGEVHDNYFKDYGENKGIFNNSNNNSNCNSGEELNKDFDNTTEKLDKDNNNNNNNNEELNQTLETENNGSASKKCVAKDIILESDDDPERMDKLKQIENESKYRDKRQIMLDVNRAFVHFPKGLKAKEKTIKQIELSNVILYSLKDHSYLHYYQGYHDICSLLLLVLGEDIAKPCAEILALYWLREYMKETLEPTLEVMSLLYPILKYADPKIYKLVYNNMIPPYFSISWVITWCIHDLRDTSEMERIFDFFISNNPIMPIYFAAAVILTQKEKLYQRFPQILEDNNKNREDETDPETAMPNFSVVHQFLTNLLPIATSQTKDVTVDSAVELAWSLYEQYPLKFLMKKESIKLNSLCCVKRYFDDCEKVLPNLPFNKEEIIKLLKEEEKLNLEMALATPTSKNDHIKKMQEKADIIGKYLSQHITLWTIATTLILVTAIILTHEFSKSYYI